jgi:ACS family hexuronate transporter-like MFS transporter
MTASTPLAVSPWRWWVCILLMQATVINYMDRIALNQMSAQIMAVFELTNEQYGLLESVFSIAFAIGIFSSGFVVDRVSVRWVYPLMVLGWSAAGVLTGFAGSFWMLLTARFMLGLFEAGNWPCALRTTRTILRPEERSFGNSLFGSGTALGAVVTPKLVQELLKWAELNEVAEAWRVPFRLIGSLGLVWIALWFLTVRRHLVDPAGAGAPERHEGATRFAQVFRDRRFWVCVVTTITVNITWHGYRVWLPLYLQKQRGYSFPAMTDFTTAYYLVADIGTWTAGLATLLFCRWGMRVHMSRVLLFGFCAVLCLGTLAVPFLPNGRPLQVGLLVVAFGALGLFPTYFAFSQELSSKHQGKVTGVLGASAHLSLAVMYRIEGRICDATGSYEWVLAGVGVFPMFALIAMLVLWPPWSQRPSPAQPNGDEEEEQNYS